ncbi:Pyranose dehydrogenase 3 [Colletotrichum sp. SAR11_59]|nr:Pyranose dehydrogenase 3 [Colletotrichum sp. SAR11_59]
MIWDVIVVGGGLAGSVISNRLAGYRPELKILVVEAEPNANDRQDIVWPNSTNTIGGDFDWKLASVPQVHVDNRSITLARGKALGGGTVINMGIGPRDELEAAGVDVKLEAPEVGKNYADHFLSPSTWNVKNPEEGWAVGSPAFPTAEQYSWGTATDFIVCSSVPKEGLAKAIEEDEGAAPGADHPLLKQEHTFFGHFFLYSGSTDGSKVAISGIFILPTSRGSIKLASGNITDSPLIDPNYLATAVDRYIVREGIRQEIAFAGSDATVLGREILDGESVPAGFDEVYTVNSTDEYIDARIRAAAR